ncbi:TPA: hypothetical protein ACH3X3_004518 [Trebouxia sp. C0006]
MRNRPWQELSISARGVLDEDGSPAVGVGPLMSCPISQVGFEDSVVAADGDTYERIALEQWLQTQTTSPVTRQLLAHEHVV